MEIEYKGSNSVIIATKKTSIVVDPLSEAKSTKSVKVTDRVVVATQPKLLTTDGASLVIDGPGEYEINNISIIGVGADVFGDNTDGNGTVYLIKTGGVSVAITGHVKAPLSEEQLEAIGVVDVAVVPVGGAVTLDASQAAGVVRQLGPKLVIPTFFDGDGLSYEKDLMGLEPFCKALGVQATESIPKWKQKNGLPEALTVVQLDRS